MAVALALSALLCYTVSGFSGGMASRAGTFIHAILVSQVSAAVLFVLLLAVLPAGPLTAGDLFWAGAAGLFVVLALLCYYFGLSKGPMSVVAPLAGACDALEPAVYGWIKGEPLTALGVAGVVLVVVAIGLLGRPQSHKTEHKATPAVIALAVVAGMMLGAIFICISQIHSTSPMPLVSQRLVAVLLIIGIAAGSGKLSLPSGRAVALAGLSGLLSVVGDLSYFFAVKQGAISVVAVIAALNPAAVGALGLVLLRERFRPVQMAGFASAIGGIVLLSAK